MRLPVTQLGLPSTSLEPSEKSNWYSAKVKL